MYSWLTSTCIFNLTWLEFTVTVGYGTTALTIDVGLNEMQNAQFNG
jgi:hypothetical protein